MIMAVVLMASACTFESDGGPTSSQEPTTSESGNDSENPQPQVSIGTSDLSHLDTVLVSGRGFEPGYDIVVAECSNDATIGSSMADVCDMSEFVPVRTNTGGEFEVSVVVRTVIGSGKRIETDCTQAQCVVGAGYLEDMAVRSTDRLRWSTRAEVPPAPVLEILSLDLNADENLGTAEVQGDGFVPGSKVNLVQCPIASTGAGVDAEDCLYDYGTVTTADSQGQFMVSAVVYPRFQRSSGELIDCVASPEVCVVADPWPQEPANRMSFVTFEMAS
jgi:hypothetical protein